MLKIYGAAIVGFLLAGLGPALSEPGPGERECMVGERRVNGECQPLTQTSRSRGDSSR